MRIKRGMREGADGQGAAGAGGGRLWLAGALASGSPRGRKRGPPWAPWAAKRSQTEPDSSPEQAVSLRADWAVAATAQSPLYHTRGFRPPFQPPSHIVTFPLFATGEAAPSPYFASAL
jgi:hypothetical protein